MGTYLFPPVVNVCQPSWRIHLFERRPSLVSRAISRSRQMAQVLADSPALSAQNQFLKLQLPSAFLYISPSLYCMAPSERRRVVLNRPVARFGHISFRQDGHDTDEPLFVLDDLH